ncbi:MAG: hypothetical protein H7Y33_15315 [Cytophagales bacterium]|nr:hypothetical protein [Rhizobacter sp.]
MFEKIIPTVVLAVCAVFIARLLIGERLRLRFDAAARRIWQRIRGWGLRVYHWRSSRKNAAQVAEDAIQRAREGGTWEGNVYKPKSFKRPPRDKLH